jgi:hypothetical protein
MDWLAVSLVAGGSLASIVLNIVSAGPGVDVTSRVVAAVPPLAALLAFTALMRQVYRALAAVVEQSPAEVADGLLAAEMTREQPAEQRPVSAPVTPPVPPQPAAPPALPAPGSTEDEPAAAAEQPPARPTYDDPRLEAIRALYETGYRPGTKAMVTAVRAATGSAPSDSGAR